MGVMEKLTNAALDAFETELKCWQRRGTWRPGTTMLVRYPMSRSIDMDIKVAAEERIEQIEMEDEHVHMFIVRAAMEKAVTAVREELGR
ncbi:hypothetical protein [Bradyrhizobium sp. USDA 241]|uniref:hypothetical protein n=1 Tax=Bradyrhizobium sp. USDA 241 TaxID=3377725 RepID=UPI003C78DBC7